LLLTIEKCFPTFLDFLHFQKWLKTFFSKYPADTTTLKTPVTTVDVPGENKKPQIRIWGFLFSPGTQDSKIKKVSISN